MRAAAVERTARRWKHPVEIRGRRYPHRVRLLPDLQPASLQHAKCPLRALFYLRCIVSMPVAIGRRVDKDQESFRTGSDGVLVVVILRADIDRRFIRQRAAHKNVVELGGIIA